MSTPTITVAYGDGIGPEIMRSVLTIIEKAGADMNVDCIDIGEKLYKKGLKAGIEPASWDVIRRNKVFLKAPITTPQGTGVKSLNVTLRKSLGLYANIRPCRSYYPFVKTKHPEMDVVIVRENEEDTYGGIEHRQTYEVYQCLKLITLPGTEKIVRHAFEYARVKNRKKVTCFTKDNIMKLTDGLFHRVFSTVAEEYPDIKAENMIVDIGAARLADSPEQFDVIVMPNLYGDIVSDIAAQISGSVGLAGSANIGERCAMFEAIHGSAPDIAGQNSANPSGLLMASTMMLAHIGQPRIAERVHNAWLKTMEEGIHTPDIYDSVHSARQVTTGEFTESVVKFLDTKPGQLEPAVYPDIAKTMNVELTLSRGEKKPSLASKRELKGVDVFVYWEPGDPEELAESLQQASTRLFFLKMFTNRGTKVWPDGVEETFCTDHWRCRFLTEQNSISNRDVVELLSSLTANDLDVIKTENLYEFDGERAYSLGQGE